MSTPCEEIRPELEALLAALSDGTLDAAAKKRLGQILRDHPDARQFYLDYCQMHALLQSAHGVLQALEAPSTVRRRRLGGIAAAAVLLVLSGAIVFLRETSHIDATVALVQGTAWIIRNGERVALPPTGEMRPGDRVATASNSRTDVLLRDGTRITLFEQTEAEIGTRINLKEGTLRCDVRPQPRPLVLQTPHAEATVLGTEFELSAAWKETRLYTIRGLVRLSADGRSVDVKAGQVAVAGAQGVAKWESVCALDFSTLKELPTQMTSAWCSSDTVHQVGRKIESGAERVRLADGGLIFGPLPGAGLKHGLTDLQWKDEVGDDLIVEVDVAGGKPWGLGLPVSGNAFEGYRVFFAAIDEYPNGVAVDTIYPGECIVLARDPRSISYDRDHTLRVEKRGNRFRAWVDGQIRIDTEINHPLAQGRRRTFSLCNFGASPVVRALRVWKAAP